MSLINLNRNLIKRRMLHPGNFHGTDQRNADQDYGVMGLKGRSEERLMS